MVLNREQLFEAKDFLESEFYKILYDRLKDKCVRKFADSDHADWEGREEAYRMMRTLNDFDKELRIFVDSLKFDR